MTALLDIRNLNVSFSSQLQGLHPVRGVELSVGEGETLCIVGESGCGKSLTGLAILGLLPRGTTRRADQMLFEGAELQELSPRRMEDLRGSRMAMIFQEPMTSLNPSYTIGYQLEEVLVRHKGATRREARDRAVSLLNRVGIPAAPQRLRQYPHQLSGGLRQRVMIAMALMCSPKLIVADEPTTALDVTIQAQILRLLADLQEEFGMGVILITHDLGIVARVADKVAVMYAGQVVETGRVAEVFANPLHPYTRALLDCIPIPGKTKAGEHLGSIPGMVPRLVGDLGGCHFRNRCTLANPECVGTAIALRDFGQDRSVRCVVP